MIHIFTLYSNENLIDSLKKSSHFHQVEINFIKKDFWISNLSRVRFLKEIVKDIPKDDIICFLDAYDVICNSNTEELIEKFLKFGTDLLISSEECCHPDYYLRRWNEKVPGQRFLNAGSYIGYQWQLFELWSWKDTDDMINQKSDQAYLIEWYLEHCDKRNVKIDSNSEVFQSMVRMPMENFELKNGRFTNSFGNPSFIHFNAKSYIKNDVNILPYIVEEMKLGSNLNFSYFNNIQNL